MADNDAGTLGRWDAPLVLSNVLSLDGNPYLELWNRAVHASGATQRALTLSAAMVRPAPDWVHLQWPDRALRRGGRRQAFQGLAALLGTVAIARLRGARVLLTAHNVNSHDPRHPHLDRLLWALLPWLVTDVHHMTRAGTTPFLAGHPRLRGARHHIVPHGEYGPLAARQDKPAARAELGLPAEDHVLVTFGSLRGYKGVNSLLDAFSACTPGTATLVVAGRVRDPGLRTRLSAETPGLVVEDAFLSQERLNDHVSAADGVVLPYRAVLNSGSAMLALTLARPVLVPDTPTFREIGERVGPGWVHVFRGPLDHQDLEDFRLAVTQRPARHPDLTWCSWDNVAEGLREVWASHPNDRVPQ